MSEIQHCVWPTPAPPVTTALWDQYAWDRWGERYRPAGYSGGIHDAEAWAAYRAAQREEEARLQRVASASAAFWNGQSQVMPCDCGSTDASWHGDGGLRQYSCDPCWDARNH